MRKKSDIVTTLDFWVMFLELLSSQKYWYMYVPMSGYLFRNFRKFSERILAMNLKLLYV
jgi:hypothetical protein